MTNKHQGVSADLDTQIEQILQGYADSHTSNQKHYGHVVLGGVVDYNFNLIADEAKAAIKSLIHKEVSEAYKKGYIDAGIQALQGGKE